MRRLLVLLALLALPAVCLADEPRLDFGGDQYAAGQRPAITAPVRQDAFLAGNDVTLSGAVAGSAHLFGMNVASGGEVGGDLYAAGFTVNVTAPVKGSVSAAGNSLAIRAPATIGGNLRLAGSSVTLAAPVAGAALVAAQTLALDAPVTEDLSFYGETLTFGPGARVGGMLSIQAPKPIEVPASVAPADRVRYTEMASPDYVSRAGNTASGVVGSFLPALWAAAIWWLLLFLVGLGFITLAPRVMAALDRASVTRPFRNFGLGVLAFASLLGLVPVVALTLVGILLLPVVLLFIVLACSLGYLSGTYFVGLRIAGALTRIDTNPRRIAVLAAALVVAGLLGMVPFLGWLIGLVLLIFGLGVIAVAMMDGWAARDAARRSLAPPAMPAAPASLT